MSRIMSNVTSMTSRRILEQNNADLTKSLQRLSTGLKINRGADDAAGLIASERLRNEKASITSAINNAERANQVANIAEGGLAEINDLLVEVQGLVSQTANETGLSDAERDANQLQIDNIMQTIDRISNTTTFAGTKLLNGGFDFQVDTISSDVENFKVNGGKFDDTNGTTVTATVTTSAQHGALLLDTAAGNLAATDSVVMEIGGALGAREFTFASGATLAEMTAAVNSFKDVLGVSAFVSGTGVALRSTEYGEDNFVSVNVVAASASTATIDKSAATNEEAATGTSVTVINSEGAGAVIDKGQDIAGLINGLSAAGKGKTLAVNTDALNTSITLSDTKAADNGAVTAFKVNGGGAKFNIGPKVNLDNQVRISFGNVASRKLGQTTIDSTTYMLDDLGSGKNLDLSNKTKLDDAQKVIGTAIDEISAMRGRLGAFQSLTVGSTIRSLGTQLENVTAAESQIRDTDFAEETATLTRNQILVQAGQSALQIANNAPQAVLGLL